MKNNTEQAKALLQRALRETPEDFALSDVRYHIRAALTKIEGVENKRNKREIAASIRKEGILPPVYDPRAALQVIDEMIAGEKAKIEEVQRRRNQPKNTGDDDYDAEAQLLG